MGGSFAEYREVSVSEPLRQGDVIESVDEAAGKWRRHLLVITADCDFASAKHHGRVTCTPLLTQDEYLVEFLIPRIRDRVVAKAVRTLQALLASTDAPTISEGRLREWPLEQDPSEIVAALRLSGVLATDVALLLAAIAKASHLSEDLDGSVERLVAAQVEVPSGKTESVALRETVETLKSHHSRPPGDAIFLSAIAPTLDAGYFAYLRHIEQVREPDIAVGPSRRTVTYRRIARLQDRFIHAVSQQFAMVFMSIGLPTDYEESRNVHSENLGVRYL